MSLPGTPVLLYGDEIGMGEDLSRPERKAVRTVMQWTDDRNGGFSLAEPDRLAAAPISGGPFGFERLNVAAQSRRRDSLLALVGDLARSRRGAEEIGAGSSEVLETGVPSVLCLRHESEGRHLVTAVNLADEEVVCQLGDEHGSGLVDTLSDREYPVPDEQPTKFVLGGYGYRWLRQRDEPFTDAPRAEGQ
jgi:maltose alpha-D-glucosyltransferase/alpha-amylase